MRVAAGVVLWWHWGKEGREEGAVKVPVKIRDAEPPLLVADLELHSS